LATALQSVVQVIGYLYWTLMDNYEWHLGTTARFGLAGVDPHTQQRYARPCAEDFARLCRHSRVGGGSLPPMS
jgi:beta-glucosidase